MASNNKSMFEIWLSEPKKEFKSDASLQNVEITLKKKEQPLKKCEERYVVEEPGEWMVDIQNWKHDNKTKLMNIEAEIKTYKETVERDKKEVETLRKENEKLKEGFAEQEVFMDQIEQKVTKTASAVLQAQEELCYVRERFDSAIIYETKHKQLTAAEQIKYERLSQTYNIFEAKCNEKITTLEASIIEIQNKKSGYEKQMQIENEKLKLVSEEFHQKRELQIQMKNECSELKGKISAKVLEEENLKKNLQQVITNFQQIGDLLLKIKQMFDKTESYLNAQFETLETSLSKNELCLTRVTDEVHKLQESLLKSKQHRKDLTKKSLELDVLIAEQGPALMKLSEKIKESDSKYREQEIKNRELLARLENLKKQNESLNLKIFDANTDNDSSKREIELKVEEKDKQIASLRDRIEEAKREREIAKKEVENAELEVNKTAKELEYVNKKITSMSNKNVRKVDCQKQSDNVSMPSNGNSKTVYSGRKQLNYKKDGTELYSMISDTEDESLKPSKQLSSSTKNYSKEIKGKTSTKKNSKKNYEEWF